MLLKESEIHDVHGITVEQKQRIMDFLQGAVSCWCKNREDEWFAARDLLGGANYHWQGTPMIALWHAYNENIKTAGQAAGRLLKQVLHEDESRYFDSKKEAMTTKYIWKKDGAQ